MKTFVEKNYLSSKPAELYLREIKQANEWQQVIQYNGGYTIGCD